MIKRLLCWAAAGLLALGGAAMAEDAPIIVDRIHSPEVEADFAFEQDAELLEIVFPQILNCDAALLRCGGETMLIDCATAQQAQRVINLLEQMGVTELDSVVNTHPHYDHLQGLELIAQAVTVRELRICFEEDSTQHMATAMEVCEKYGITVTHFSDGDQMTLGDAVIDVWLKGDDSWDLNNRSAQMRVQYGERTALFTADMESKLQNRILEVIPAELLDIDVLKYPHHGLAAVSKEYLAATTPLFAVITNNGGKTSRSARAALNSAKVPFAITVPGYVALFTDGETWLVQRLEMDKPVTVTSRPDTRE